MIKYCIKRYFMHKKKIEKERKKERKTKKIQIIIKNIY